MLRTQKTTVVDEIKGRFDRMTSAVFVDFTGMTVDEVSRLRNNLRAKGVDYKVVKNTLIKRALADTSYAPKLNDVLKGMTGVAWSYEEPSAAARVVKDFARENEKLKVKAGLLEGQVLDGRAVETQLATLPSKDEARAMLLATFNAPAETLLRLLNTPAGSFVRVLSAKEQKG